MAILVFVTMCFVNRQALQTLKTPEHLQQQNHTYQAEILFDGIADFEYFYTV